MQKPFIILLALLALALPMACDDDDDSECTFGEDYRPCTCDDGSESEQFCLPDESGFGECDCSVDDTCTDIDDKEVTVQATIKVPDGFTGEPEGMICAFYERVPDINASRLGVP